MNINGKKNLAYSFKLLTAVFLLICFSTSILANDLILTLGGGKQPDSNQENKTASLDFNFFEYKRSDRQTINIGMSYTQIKTDFETGKKIQAISIYPQLTLFPPENSWFSNQVSKTTIPYFFVRALWPT